MKPPTIPVRREIKTLMLTRTTGKTEALNWMIQSQNAERLMYEPRTIFQRLSLQYIAMPDMWSPVDQERGVTEGWAIGNNIELPSKQNTQAGQFAPGARITTPRAVSIGIGRASGTFTCDADASAWVTQQARQSDKWSIYNRALAVIAALSIRNS
jgi:hypothetical protein